MADCMAEDGFRDVGYEYVSIDVRLDFAFCTVSYCLVFPVDFSNL